MDNYYGVKVREKKEERLRVYVRRVCVCVCVSAHFRSYDWEKMRENERKSMEIPNNLSVHL